MDEMLKKAQSAGSVVHREKVWSLGMKEMIKRYVRKKKLEVNAVNTKMIVFNRRKRKSEENEWNCEGTKIEQVN
jgi:hypothetical protein